MNPKTPPTAQQGQEDATSAWIHYVNQVLSPGKGGVALLQSTLATGAQRRCARRVFWSGCAFTSRVWCDRNIIKSTWINTVTEGHYCCTTQTLRKRSGSIKEGGEEHGLLDHFLFWETTSPLHCAVLEGGVVCVWRGGGSTVHPSSLPFTGGTMKKASPSSLCLFSCAWVTDRMASVYFPQTDLTLLCWSSSRKLLFVNLLSTSGSSPLSLQTQKGLKYEEKRSKYRGTAHTRTHAHTHTRTHTHTHTQRTLQLWSIPPLNRQWKLLQM